MLNKTSTTAPRRWRILGDTTPFCYTAILERGATKRTGTQRDGTGVRAWSEEWSEEESGRIRTPRKNAARRRATTTCFGRTCWPDSLSPMLHSLLPDLARDIDARREVVFLDKELRRLARFTRQYEGGEPDENRCKLGVSKFKFCANAFFVTPTHRSRSHWASLRRKRPGGRIHDRSGRLAVHILSVSISQNSGLGSGPAHPGRVVSGPGRAF